MGKTGEIVTLKGDSFNPEVDVLASNEFDDADELTEISIEEVMEKMSAGLPFGSWAKSNRREGPKIGRNEPCPCGSGKKFKKCCEANV